MYMYMEKEPCCRLLLQYELHHSDVMLGPVTWRKSLIIMQIMAWIFECVYVCVGGEETETGTRWTRPTGGLGDTPTSE